MGRDASLQVQPYENLDNQTIDSEVGAKDRVIGTVGNVAHNVKEKVHIAIEVVKEGAHDAAETIKWQAGEVREGLQKRLSVDHSAVVIPELSPIPEEPATPILKDPFTPVSGSVEAVSLPRAGVNRPNPEEWLNIARANDMPHEKIAVIPMVDMQVDEGSLKPAPATLFDKVSATQRAWEKSAHEARLRMDATLEKQFGGQADKLQAEMERARVSAIAGTARLAELFQAQFRKASTMLREQRQPVPLVAAPSATDERQPGLLPPTPRPPLAGEQAIAPTVGLKQPLDVIPHNLRATADDDLEKQLGEEKTLRNLAEGETLRERSISETARVANLIQEQLGKVASTLRDQQQHGMVPVYR